MAGPLNSAFEPSPRGPSRLELALQRFLRELPPPRRESPGLLAERAAQFALKCRELRHKSDVPARFQSIHLRETADAADGITWLPAAYRSLAASLLELIDRPQLIAIGGERGAGKTALACGLVNAFCDLGRPAVYRRVADFFDELGSSAWEDKAKVRSDHARPDLLVLDEVQVRDADKDWQDNELTTLIDRRYGEQKATVLLSNLTPAALRDNLGVSIWRRLIEEGGVFETNWPRIESLRAAASAPQGRASGSNV